MNSASTVRRRRLALLALLLVVLTGAYWLLPISGQVTIAPGGGLATLWPQMRLDPSSRPGGALTLTVTDIVAWTHVQVTEDGRPLALKDPPANIGGAWSWRWTVPALATSDSTLVFYHSCDTGCVERGRIIVGTGGTPGPLKTVPTKLGVVFANPSRDWHGRSGWDVELTYARLAGGEYWGVDDLAARIAQATAKGLKVLVRIDLVQGQSLPPANDFLALTEYLQYVQRLARDDRLRNVYGYLIGSGFNELGSNSLAPQQPVTAQWYARLFNGYGEVATRTDNVVQTIRAENVQVRVLVGPVRPWNRDQNGERRYTIDMPWLNYMNTLVAALDEAAQAKSSAGIPLVAPDGFAVNASGRLVAPELAGRPAAEEPRLDLRRSEWDDAQAGFRVYRDWLAIINAYPATRGLPVYINAANTFTADDGTVPAQNYPRGWLTTALDAINQEPQVLALCWFLDADQSGDSRWDNFSLARQPGRLIDAAEEFDALLQRGR